MIRGLFTFFIHIVFDKSFYQNIWINSDIFLISSKINVIQSDESLDFIVCMNE